MSNTIEVSGLTFAIEVKHDEGMGAPWKEHDGHGIVSDWTMRPKHPGERTLGRDGPLYQYYDFNATLKLAKTDGWGVQDTAGKSKVQMIAEAVERDYAHLRAWCEDKWHWVYVLVTLLDIKGAKTLERASCGGIESSEEEYLQEVAKELAEEIAARVGDSNVVCQTVRRVTQ